ncbi:uncharacterized protein LOC100278030 [Zea mays]|uniref:Uncharacterized protein n=1 Tax=Zea mays TaxID=4577 RepID=B6U368_MAIZE|nr:uncharacterized protein LOC100278030 [Zea mays]ACG43801.1 hypothetical protein [Zea mays]|eukprot:NP_001144913.1 uncharacterized protein LOC100278030 [Zea mays]
MALLVDPPDIKREMQMEMHHLLRRRHRRRRGRRIGRWTGARSILHRRPYISLVLGLATKVVEYMLPNFNEVFGLECAQSVTLMAKRNEVPWVRMCWRMKASVLKQ